MGRALKKTTPETFFYRCRCGYIFEESYGKYGCPFCGGNPPARLVKISPAKEMILKQRTENEEIKWHSLTTITNEKENMKFKI